MGLDADVIVIGCGPVGATLANLLGARGVRTLVLERELDVYPLPRAAHIDHQGLRVLQEIGCLQDLLGDMVRNRALDLVNARRELLLRVPADQPSVSGLPASMYFYQPPFDRRLREAAAARPEVTIATGAEMISFDARADGVTVAYRTRDGQEHRRTGAWLVGCDGARSPVREMAGLRQRSLDFEERWLVIDVALRSPQPQLPLDRVLEVCDPARPHLSTPICAGRQRFEFMLLPHESESIAEPAFISAQLARWLRPGDYDIARAAVYTFAGRVAESWRDGRVLIAGDAAHLMPPFLGQGMCSGMRDAANLAWKLDLVFRGRAPDTLLDTYGLERAPHVTAITEAAIRIGQVICELDPARARIRDDELLRDRSPAKDRLAFALPRLQPGPLILENGGGLFIQPEIEGRRLDDIVGPRFLVLGRAPRHLEGADAAWWRAQGALVATLGELAHPDLTAWLDRYEVDVVVVRPDRYVLGADRTLARLTRHARLALEAVPSSGASLAA